ncbi:Rossmann-fold NAD(P)-binding domain-containing protein [Fructilactobacillus lindneri]|uniref:Malate lactate dehydrogenase n=2 Tax=Fructilactobacillus lindneri TaxID=53444 RepID=A0A0R2JVG1_9LACO|nr:lactate dehydrogenase [Fructilactobacillus lindneri]KRN78340.1 malate lactate dehydrogenase [Fructilactobacillus lindneri DSM 20690 = JCM 11027]
MSDLSLSVLVDDEENFSSDFLASEMCQNLDIKEINSESKLDEFDVMIYLPNTDFYNPKVTDPARIAEDISDELDKFRDTINDVISRGFKGKIILDAPHDEVFVYFAAYFSGFDVNNIMGLGTLPQEMILREKLVTEFKVSDEDINVNTLGLSTNNLVAWSRVYIGPATLLSYIASENNNFDSKLITDVQEMISDPQIVTNLMIQAKAIIKLLNYLSKSESLICSVVSLNKENDKFSLNLSPKLINHNGIIQSINLQLSDDETKEVDDDLKWATDIIENIKEGKAHGKKD